MKISRSHALITIELNSCLGKSFLIASRKANFLERITTFFVATVKRYIVLEKRFLITNKLPNYDIIYNC